MFIDTTSTELNDDLNEDDIAAYEKLIEVEDKIKENKYEILDYLYDTIVNYIDNYMLQIYRETFESDIKTNVYYELFLTLENMYSISLSEYEELYTPDDLIAQSIKLIYSKYMPPRNYTYTFVRDVCVDRDSIETKLTKILAKEQPDQRTKEWYMFRYNHITASNAWKCFESESLKNSIIYQKCIPLNFDDNNSEKSDYVNVNSPLHWGHKYEPLSILIYETVYDTKIEEFGCIEHDDYPFLAASPDGINVKKENPRYGRMLEIKNIVNRDIVQNPKKEYWVQMQLQMEVTNLNECDFLETRFKEYDNEDEYSSDGEEYLSIDKKRKGKILLFYDNQRPLYEYYIPEIHQSYEEWEEIQFNNHKDHMFMKTIYWKLDEFSCILVLRNKKWFEVAIEYILSLIHI